MRKKLAKHVKGVREKKTSRDKERTFYRVSPPGRIRTTNLNYPKEKKIIPKLSSKLFSFCSGKHWAFIGKISSIRGPYWAIRVHGSKYDVGSIAWLRKRGHVAVRAVMPGCDPCTCSIRWVLTSG